MEVKPEVEKKSKDWEPRILAFLCRWCSYAGADLTGSSRISYPPNVRILRVPCSGRVNPLFILKTLRAGMDGILVSGCHPGDCHYTAGNYTAPVSMRSRDRQVRARTPQETGDCRKILSTASAVSPGRRRGMSSTAFSQLG